MLTENQVVDTTCLWLEQQGWEIESRCHDTSQGDDILASSSGTEIAVECKGAISPKTMLPFHSSYIWRSISGALFNTIRNIERPRSGRIDAMALPNTQEFRAMTNILQEFCERNNVYVFWVVPEGVAEVWQPIHSIQRTGQKLRFCPSVDPRR